MKRLLLLVTILMLVLSPTVWSQVSQGGVPPSFELALRTQFDERVLPAVDMDEVRAMEAEEQAQGMPYRYGVVINVNYDLENSGTWENLPNGDRLWRLKIISSQATSLEFVYDIYWLPEGAKLFIYNEDHREVIGAFTAANNTEMGIFATQMTRGEVSILEYYEPSDVSEPGQLVIAQVIHGYKDLFPETRDFGDSQSCHNNVNCPVGDNWQDQKRAVARITANGYLCSGALINNTRNDLTPYFHSANHCSGAIAPNSIFYFNYESSTCPHPGVNGPTNNTVFGCTILANGEPSDFMFVRLSEQPPAEYNLYYAGWNANDQSSPNSTGIHHPSGDVKKISFDNQATYSYPSIINWQGGTSSPPHSHWSVIWDDGVTEGGSSGSPLFDHNHRIMGQLHGGGSACLPNGQPNGNRDHYGKLSWAYDSIVQWLDPDNTGVTEYDGTDHVIAANQPQNVMIMAVENGIELSWEIPSGVMGLQNFVIYRDGAELATPGAAETSYVDDTVEAGSYCYTITALYDTGESVAVPEMCVIVGPAALEFNGATDLVNCGNDPAINLANTFSFQAWIYPTGWGETANDGFGTIFDKTTVRLYMQASNLGQLANNLIFEANYGGFYYPATTPVNSIVLNQWQHITVSYHQFHGLHIYINGIDQPINYPNGTPAGLILSNVDHNLYLGESMNRDGAFEGLITDVRLWNDDLPAETVFAQFNTPLTGSEESLVGYWPLNDGLGETCQDLSIYGNTATILGADWVVGVTIPFDLPPYEFRVEKAGAAMELLWIVPPGVQDLQNFKIYRNDELLETVGTEVTVYTDPDVAEGLHCYQVSAVYDDREVMSRELCVVAGPAALSFLNDLDMVEMGNAPEFNFDRETPFTVEAWIKVPSSSGMRPIISKLDSDQTGWEMRLMTNHKLTFILANDWGSNYIMAFSGSGLPMDDEWRHVACAYDTTAGVDPVKMWIDGVESPVTIAVNSLNDSFLSEATLKLGRNAGGNTFTGIIDDVRLWDHVRTTDEIFNNMDYHLNGHESGLLGYWDMDQGAGSVLTDLSPLGNDGMIMDADWTIGYPLRPNSVEDDTPIQAIPTHYALSQNYPNPFNPSTRIAYQLPVKAPISLKVFNSAGQFVKSLAAGVYDAGFYEVSWDGTNVRHQRVANGIYFYQLRTPEKTLSSKMIMLR